MELAVAEGTRTCDQWLRLFSQDSVGPKDLDILE